MLLFGSKSEENWSSVKLVRNNNYYVRTLNTVKKAFYSSKIVECKNNTKKLYNTINGLVNRQKVNPLSDRPSEELAAQFPDFFYNKIKDLANNLKQFANYLPPVRSTPTFSNFRLVTAAEVRKILVKLGHKQYELDTFPVGLIADNINVLSEKLKDIINISFTLGQFPDDWKNALIKPLIKKPDLGPLDTNYRPVSNLLFFSKVLECACSS